MSKKSSSIKLPIKYELYSPELDSVDNIEKALNFINLDVSKKQIGKKFDTLIYIKSASSFTKARFYHGLSHYDFSENWIAKLSANVCWSHLSAIVEPEDILKHPEGLCSQQTIVFMELLKRRGIKHRSLGLGYKEGPGHFLAEVYYNKEWHLYDVNKEPKWEKIKNHHKSMEYYLLNKDTLFIPYEDQMEKSAFYKILEKVEYGKINEFPAKNMILFHRITKTFTYIIPLFFFLLAFRVYSKTRKSTKFKEGKIAPVNTYEKV